MSNVALDGHTVMRIVVDMYPLVHKLEKPGTSHSWKYR